MTDNNKQENKQETLNEEERKTELSMEDLEQVTGGLAPTLCEGHQYLSGRPAY